MFDPRASDPNKKKKQLASLFTSKGCVAACTFCQREAGGYRVFDLNKLGISFVEKIRQSNFLRYFLTTTL